MTARLRVSVSTWGVLVVLTAGCSGGDASDGAPEQVDAAEAIEASETIEASPVSSGEEAQATPLIAGLPGGTGIAVTSPSSGGGVRPELAWEAVAGAETYSVMVYDPDGVPYWGWETTETTVRVGLSDRPDDAPGPRVAEGMTWAVLAHDADGVPVAASDLHPVAP